MTVSIEEIPEQLRDAYVLRLKRVHGRRAMEAIAEAQQVLEPYNEAFEREFGALLDAYPDQHINAESFERFETAKAEWEADFEIRFPGFHAAMKTAEDAHASYGQSLADIRIEFLTDGGTEEQFQTLNQAVLNGAFSRKNLSLQDTIFKEFAFDPDLFQKTPEPLRSEYIPQIKGLFNRQGGLPPDIRDMEDPYEHPAFKAYMEAGAEIINRFQEAGGTREQWNNLFFAARDNVPALKV